MNTRTFFRILSGVIIANSLILMYYTGTTVIEPEFMNLPEYYYGKGAVTVVKNNSLYWMAAIALFAISVVMFRLSLNKTPRPN